MYEKEFDSWNTLKKRLNNRSQVYYREGDVWWCHFGVNVGSEQDGVGKEALRPILVLREINKDTLICVPLTARLRHDKDHVAIYFNEEFETVILSQIKVIDTRRLLKFRGRISLYLFGKIKKALRTYLLA